MQPTPQNKSRSGIAKDGKKSGEREKVENMTTRNLPKSPFPSCKKAKEKQYSSSFKKTKVEQYSSKLQTSYQSPQYLTYEKYRISFSLSSETLKTI